MEEFVFTNWTSIFAVFLIVVSIVVATVVGKRKIIYKILYTLVTEAEEMHGRGTGALKLARVMQRFYEMLPRIFRAFVTYGRMKSWIEAALVAAKKRWAEEAEDGEK